MDAEYGGRTENENKVIAEQLKAAWESLKATVVASEAKAAEAADAAGETALMKAEHELEVASKNLETKRQACKRVDFTDEAAWNTAREHVEGVLISMSTTTPRATGGGGHSRAGGHSRPQVCPICYYPPPAPDGFVLTYLPLMTMSLLSPNNPYQ